MDELRNLPNIGKVTAMELVALGIDTPQKLREVGSREAFLRMRTRDPGVCLSLLCGLEGAVRGVRWHHMDSEVKAELKAFYDGIKGK